MKDSWYARNKSWYLPKVLKRDREITEKIRTYKNKPCADCGVSYPAHVMDFDHVNGQKLSAVSRMRSYSWKRIEEEIAKCDVVCANCHRVRTYSRSVV